MACGASLINHRNRTTDISLVEELARCDREIAEAEATLRSGYPDIDGCLLWLYDWRVERKLIEDEISALRRNGQRTQA